MGNEGYFDELDLGNMSRREVSNYLGQKNEDLSWLQRRRSARNLKRAYKNGAIDADGKIITKSPVSTDSPVITINPFKPNTFNPFNKPNTFDPFGTIDLFNTPALASKPEDSSSIEEELPEVESLESKVAKALSVTGNKNRAEKLEMSLDEYMNSDVRAKINSRYKLAPKSQPTNTPATSSADTSTTPPTDASAQTDAIPATTDVITRQAGTAIPAAITGQTTTQEKPSNSFNYLDVLQRSGGTEIKINGKNYIRYDPWGQGDWIISLDGRVYHKNMISRKGIPDWAVGSEITKDNYLTADWAIASNSNKLADLMGWNKQGGKLISKKYK